MITVFSEEHALRNARTELCGGELVTPFECPQRVDFILEQVKSVGLGGIVKAEKFGIEPVLRVHDSGFIDFLESCWQESRGKITHTQQ